MEVEESTGTEESTTLDDISPVPPAGRHFIQQPFLVPKTPKAAKKLVRKWRKKFFPTAPQVGDDCSMLPPRPYDALLGITKKGDGENAITSLCG